VFSLDERRRGVLMMAKPQHLETHQLIKYDLFSQGNNKKD
jgi:hypothetical protein